jgi:hypothetical protein
MSRNTLSSKEERIISKLRNLANEAKNQSRSESFVKSVNTLANRLENQIKSISPGSIYPTNLQATIRALEIWINSPSKYAYGADIPANRDVGRLDPNDDNKRDYKCNRFVSDVFTESGAASGYSYEGKEPYSYPTYGLNPYNRYPVSANEIYASSVPNMISIDNRKAKIGDIVSFPPANEENPRSSAHVGIYLGDGLYISAHQTNSPYGRQVSDGVEISSVNWSSNPRFKRFEGQNQPYSILSQDDSNNQILVASFDNQSKASIQSFDNGSENKQEIVKSLTERRANAIIAKLEKAGISQDSDEFKSAFIGVVKNLKNLEIDEKKDLFNVQGFNSKVLDNQQLRTL